MKELNFNLQRNCDEFQIPKLSELAAALIGAFIRLVAIVTISWAAVGVDSDTAFARDIEYPILTKGEPYRVLRAKLISMGWTPFHNVVDPQACNSDDPRCKDYPEVTACAGTREANCKFVWVTASGNRLEVNTVGETSPEVESLNRVLGPTLVTNGVGTISYYDRVVAKINEAKKKGFYPGNQGRVCFEFSLGDEGEIKAIEILRPSGQPSLDLEAVAMVERGAPYPKPAPGDKRTFNLTLIFTPRETAKIPVNKVVAPQNVDKKLGQNVSPEVLAFLKAALENSAPVKMTSDFTAKRLEYESRLFDSGRVTLAYNKTIRKIFSTVLTSVYSSSSANVVEAELEFINNNGQIQYIKLRYLLKREDGFWKIDDVGEVKSGTVAWARARFAGLAQGTVMPDRFMKPGDPSVAARMRALLGPMPAIALPRPAFDQPASAVNEFAAAIDRKGYGRCHMDECNFFIIESVKRDGIGKDGALYTISQQQWGERFRYRANEFSYRPISIGKKRLYESKVFCSKTRPTLFNLSDGKWEATSLRPGDEQSIGGANEDANLFYWAACHNYITHDAVSFKLANRLGYRFALHPGEETAIGSDSKPEDMLR